MATTSGTTLPPSPYGGLGGTCTAPMMEMEADAAVSKGDLLVFNGSQLTTDNQAVPVGALVGIALNTVTAAAAVLQVALATPGALFEMNIVDNVSDWTGGVDDTIGIERGTIESADGYPCVDENVTTGTDIIRTLWWGKQMNTTQDANPFPSVGSGVGVTNPRVVICFTSSVFHVTA